MLIGLLGGVFDDPMGRYAESAPENVLRKFLTEAGHDVVPLSAGRRVPSRLRCDVYHGHHFGTAAYQLALGGFRPFVFTSHNPFLVSDFPVAESRLERELQRLVLRVADAVVALSSREAELLARGFDVDAERFVVIPNGLDLELYGPPAGERAGGPPRLLCVAQLVDYKGHRYLLEALARLPDARLTLVAHRFDLREELEGRARDLGVADRVEIEGPLRTEELVVRYRACDVYVQPSLAECFPVTVLEAMACGLPVVATDVGGVAEEVGDGGIVVPPRDPIALAAAIERLLGDEAERRARGESAARLARERYDGRRVAQRHVELYEQLADRRRAAPLPRRLAAAAAVAAYERRSRVARFVPSSVRRRKIGIQ